MRRKSIAFLMAIVMLVTTFAFQFSAFAATDSGITVQFQNGNNSTSSNSIRATFNVINNGSAPLNLADLKLRYYYTKDANTAQNFWCDHSGYMSGYNYIDVTSKVKGSFVSMSETTSTADTYLEVSFASDAGSLPVGGSITIQTRAARTDWSNYDQSNDYSFKAAGSLIDWDQVTGYVGGDLKYGKEPIKTQPGDPSITPTSAIFDKAAPADVAVTIIPNGNTFKGIDGLTKDTDYTVSGNTVAISKSKLATYADDSTQKFAFDFGVSTKPVLTVTIKGIKPPEGLQVTIGKAEGKTGDTVTVPVTFADVAKVGSVGVFGFNVNYDSKLLEAVKVEPGDIVVNPEYLSSQINDGSISFLFLDETMGSKLISKDGIVANITFKIKGTAAVTTPVTFANGATFGDAAMANITKLTLINGSVKIIPGPDPKDPAIDPTTLKFEEGSASDLVVNLTPNGNTFSDIKELKSSDYKVSGDKVTVSKDYLNSLKAGTYTLTFNFSGKTVTLTITVTPKPDGKTLLVTIGKAEGKTGDTVTVPVTFADVAKVGNVGVFGFNVNYDSKLLEAVKVEAGDVVVNPEYLSSQINDGSISFLFLDETMGSKLISKDGIVANITFKIKGTTAVTTPLTFANGATFGDAAMANIAKVTLTEGSVKIIPGPDKKDPTIDPTTATFKEGNASDLVVTLTPNDYAFSDIKELKSSDYTVSGDKVTVSKDYLNSLKAGTYTLTFNFSGKTVTLTITVTAIPDDKALLVAIGKAEGKTGATVTVPVTFADVAKVGNVGVFGFNVNYDSKLLEAVSVEPGDIVVNPSYLSTQINDGSISFLFLDETMGSKLISKDGVVANITFKVKGTTEVTTPLTFATGATFGDAAMANIAKVTLTDGSVKIIPVPVEKDPTIDPTTAKFEEGSASDLVVNLTPNGNTFSDIKELKSSDYTVSGDKVTVSKDYLNGLKAGTYTLTFNFSGKTVTLTITVTPKPDDKALLVTIGKAEGKTGATVTVPVTFADVAKVGNVGVFGFNVNYDSKLLEAVSVEAGDIVVNPNYLSTQINDGSISFLFLDETMGSKLVSKDGVVANITFKVKGTTEVTTPLTFATGATFGDAAMANIAKVTLTDGSVKIIPGTPEIKDPTIDPTTAAFEENSASDLAIKVTPNGNTFVGITGLTKGTDYTVSDNTVTISKSYLNGLAAGTKALTFDFGSAKNPVLTITVTKKPEVKGLGATIGTASGKAGDTITVPVTFTNVAKVGNVGVFGFNVNYDSKLLEAVKVEAGDIVINPNYLAVQINNGSISFLFLDETMGNKLVTKDGVAANITFKVIGSTSATAPLTFANGVTFGDANMNNIADVTLANGSVKLN